PLAFTIAITGIIKKIFILELIYNVALVSGVQQSDSVIHIHMYIHSFLHSFPLFFLNFLFCIGV
ncbi:hypothetical protein, partial [Klebsiella pneumoniae]